MTLIIILHVIISVFLVGVILLQPGKSDSGIGFGSTSQSIFGSRGAGNILTRTTAVAAAIFLTTSFILARHRMQETGGSVVRFTEQSDAPAAGSPSAPTPTGSTPAAPATPPATGGKAEPSVPKK